MNSCSGPKSASRNTPSHAGRSTAAAAALIILGLCLGWLSPAAGVGRIDAGRGPVVGDGHWVWPLQPRPEVIARFEPPDKPWGSGHRGVDLLAAAGQQVLAIGAGQVTFAGMLAGRGVVVVRHGALRSTYEPVDPQMRTGSSVSAGEVIGTLQAAHSHCAPRVCLHLGVKRGDTYLDPLSLLGPREVRLKPLGDGPAGVDGSASVTPQDGGISATVRRGTARPTSTSPPAHDVSGPTTWRGALGGATAIIAGLLLGGSARRQARG